MASAITTVSAANQAGTSTEVGGVRRSEWVVLAFLFYAQAISLSLPVAAAVQFRVLTWNSAIIMGYVLLLYFDALKPSLAGSVIRDWLPLAIVLLAYREVGWFAKPHVATALEFRWVLWDRLLLRHGGKAAIEALGPIIPSVLEIAYALVYSLAPFSIAVLYLTGNRDRVDRFLFLFTLGVLLCYAQFPFWPSEPPRVAFAGQDLPGFDTVFRRFNLDARQLWNPYQRLSERSRRRRFRGGFRYAERGAGLDLAGPGSCL